MNLKDIQVLIRQNAPPLKYDNLETKTIKTKVKTRKSNVLKYD